MSPSIDFYIFGISNSVEELLLRTSRFDTTSLNTENFLVVTIQIYGLSHTHPSPAPPEKVTPILFRSPPPQEFGMFSSLISPHFSNSHSHQTFLWEKEGLSTMVINYLQFLKIDAHYAVLTLAFNCNFLTNL